MLGNRSPERRAALMASDFAIAALVFSAAGYLRNGSAFPKVWNQLGLPDLALAIPLFGAMTVLLYWVAGAYRQQRHWSFRSDVRDVVRATALVLAATLSLLFILRYEDVSRIQLTITFAFLPLFALGVRWWLRSRLRAQAASGRTVRNVLVVGTSSTAQHIVSDLLPVAGLGTSVVGFLGNHGAQLGSVPRLGSIDDLPEVLASIVVDEVLICLPYEEWSRLDALTGLCEEQGKTVRIPVDVPYTISKGELEDLEGLPILSLSSTPEQRVALALKQIFDIAVAAALLVLLSPILALASLAILVVDGRPILFAQSRAGLHGRTFRLLKFRTMVNGAEEHLERLNGHNEREGPAFKMRDDPRVTRTGRFLRKASLDELPQLINVLRGDMSLVGPRPPLLSETTEYAWWQRRRLSMKPGITGLWQVTARDDPSFDRWVKLDLDYIDSWSWWLDLQILAKTPKALVKMPGS